MSAPALAAPFPWFGGKSRVADVVWRAFGDVKHYVEPFAGSLAVLLLRPSASWCAPTDRVESVNDKDAMVCNFWRALKFDPDGVLEHSDWPINESDLHARHRWLRGQRESLRELVESDPDYFDAKIAGWWVWGLSASIMSNWCNDRAFSRTIPAASLQGVHKISMRDKDRRRSWLRAISDRLRYVRVACGDWTRIADQALNHVYGVTGIFLDPPYSAESGRQKQVVYGAEDFSIAHRVREWAIRHGENPLLRIALCGYDGEHEMPPGWRCHRWQNSTGRIDEIVWFSPNCLEVSDSQLSLF